MHGALPTARDRADGKSKSSPNYSKSMLPRVPPAFFYLLTALLLLSTWIRQSTVDKNDPFKCHALLDNGQWIDTPESGRSSKPFQKWQPGGCMLRPYSGKAVSSCLGHGTGTDAIFIGDSTVREVFWAMARKLDPVAAEEQIGKITQKHADVQFKGGATNLDFVWDPFLNSSRLMHTLDASRSNAENPDRLTLPNSKALVVLGGGLWYARVDGGLDHFKNAMDKVADPAHKQFHHDIKDDPGANRVLIMPVQPPYYKLLDAEHTADLKPKTIDAMNKYMGELESTYEVDVLLSFLDMEASAPAYQPNGLHVTSTVAASQADVILNARCNNEYQSYPFAGTCCYDYPASVTQVAFIFFGFVGLVVLAVLEGQGRWFRSGMDDQIEPLKKHSAFLRPCLIFWAGLYYCYLADRTHLFNKYSKQYNNVDFFVFCFFIALVGVTTITKSVNPQRPGSEKPVSQEQPFLSRDQTDEWKGWMQLLILAYHYTGGSKILWIYKFIRLLVASYLFMSGYGHAAYFYQKKDFSLKRVVAVNFRLNLLSVLLPWMTDADYLFYYFAPLVTYWYIVIYVTMRIKASWNQILPFFLAKIALACACTSFLHTQPWLLAPLFEVVNNVFGSKWDASEWLFRCQLDQLIVYVGMVVAVLYIRQSQPQPPPPPPQDPMANTSHTRLNPQSSQQGLGSSIFYALDIVALFAYGYLTSTRTTKTSSNALHTWISPLPILAFIHLRNATPTLRNHYSTAYAWVGKISLETFVMQYHIWLASDTKGLLSSGLFTTGSMDQGGGVLQAFGIGPGMGLGRWAECILIGTVFIWVSKKIADATGGVTAGAMKMMFK